MPRWARCLLHRLGWPTHREFAFYHLGDIFGYYAQKAQILGQLRQAAAEIVKEHEQLRDGPSSAYLTVVGHSMGSVVAFDFLHEAQRSPGRDGELRTEEPQLAIDTDRGLVEGLVAAGLFTLGSPLALFSLLQGEGQHHYRAEGGPPFRLAPGGVWCNFYDEEDVVSFPLQGLFGALVEDIRVDNCRLPLAGAIFSHGGYWRSAEVARRLARHIVELQEAAAASGPDG
jgi:pimeloyl-ACP methyl ester carboxylesterase